MEDIDIAALVREAEQMIRPYIRRTILDYSPYFSRYSGANVFFKCENLQFTGSFKARGAMSKLLSLTEAERSRGVVTASTGNHGAAVAFGLQRVQTEGIIFVPEQASKSKLSLIEEYGADIKTFGTDSAQTEAYARHYADQHNMVYISPYNDTRIIGGQGTIAVELTEQIENIDAIFVALGGGGLVSGIAGYLKSFFPGIEVVACSPNNSQVMIQSIQAGQILDLPSQPTLSDGTAGGVEKDSITFSLCQRLVDGFVTVDEEEIAANLREFLFAQHMLIEGSAAVAIAAFDRVKAQYRDKTVVIVLCGANIDLSQLQQIL